MRDIQYKDFSLATHEKNWQRQKPNVCQFELTFKCDLHCKHCYADCYNTPSYIRKELSTKEVKSILDKVYESGVIWLCFTGGDPITRGDFLDIYSYAKDKGFIITIFTSGYSMTDKIADYLKKSPPFVIEITLNAVTKKTYKDISGLGDSFDKVIAGIDMIKKRGLPLKIKTQVTRQNIEELSQIREFVEGLGLEFQPTPVLYARLNGDITPCNLRITPQQVLDMNEKSRFVDVEARDLSQVHTHEEIRYRNNEPSSDSDWCMDKGVGLDQNRENQLFRCALGTGDGFCIDPYGNMITCLAIRRPAVSLLRNSISNAQKELFSGIRMREFKTDSKCRQCGQRDLCSWCPGRALLESGDMELSIAHYCELVYLIEKSHLSKSKELERVIK